MFSQIGKQHFHLGAATAALIVVAIWCFQGGYVLAGCAACVAAALCTAASTKAVGDEYARRIGELLEIRRQTEILLDRVSANLKGNGPVQIHLLARTARELPGHVPFQPNDKGDLIAGPFWESAMLTGVRFMPQNVVFNIGTVPIKKGQRAQLCDLHLRAGHYTMVKVLP